MNWIEVKTIEQVNDLINKSEAISVLFFKHSTRCSISIMAKDRIERNWNINTAEVIPVYLDLIQYRSISNYLAETLAVEHQSPQVILVKNKKAIYNESHNMIQVKNIEANL